MKLAFYYHIPIALKNGKLFLPGYIGVFVDELAKHVDTLYVLLHEAKGREIEEADYQLEGENIFFVNLGAKTPSWHRSIAHRKILNGKMKEIACCDALLVRSPTPLAPYFYNYLNQTKLFYLVVGDYAEGAKQIGTKGLKNKLLYAYFMHNDKQYRKRLSKTDVFVNSPELYNKYKTEAKSIELVKTTTLREEDFFENKNTTLNNPISLLFTGRIEANKGLIELVEAGKQLINKGKNIHINIVGWENNPEKPFEKKIIALAKSLDIEKHLTFHGKKKLGAELNQYYRNADIYVLPSYHEGFPRTIWEAMANKLPVVTTNVGAIPFYLKNEESAYIVAPKNINDLSEALNNCIENKDLRNEIITKGYNLAKDSSLSIQTAKIIEHIKNKI